MRIQFEGRIYETEEGNKHFSVGDPYSVTFICEGCLFEMPEIEGEKVMLYRGGTIELAIGPNFAPPEFMVNEVFVDENNSVVLKGYNQNTDLTVTLTKSATGEEFYLLEGKGGLHLTCRGSKV